MLPEDKKLDFRAIYAGFDSPITALDCGKKCAPHNEHGVPFCCDTSHAVPTAYTGEWQFLQGSTNLWHLWDPDDPHEKWRLENETPEGMVLIECLGHKLCQRGFRSLTCRAFPFFPYLNSAKEFIGLSYYWEYEDRCWVISNLNKISTSYRMEFITTFDGLFARLPGERENYAHHSAHMRRAFIRRRRTIPLLHRDGLVYKISPRTEKMKAVSPHNLPKFGPYKIAAMLPFPDELENGG